MTVRTVCITNLQSCLQPSPFAFPARLGLEHFPLRQNFWHEFPETFRVKWNGLFHPGEEPCFQFQT